jgi:predicted aspartyl protease
MNWIPYRQGASIPAYPCLHIRVWGVDRGLSIVLRAAIDTGATTTVMPSHVLKEAGAFRLTGRNVLCRGYDGAVALLPLYEVSLSIEDHRWPVHAQRAFDDVLVIGANTPEPLQPPLPGTPDALRPGAPQALLGLDIIAAWHLHLDGRNSRYAVE